ncbi:polygalacturonase-like [Agrilus planipennis]|uniref:endo-polygalacturonase n=1 Tax=Agrilus planipennis TaxID=224129 RepID=A0A1W4XB40_AGRPL|nr:polygalacturonase-like [Agrilus planipennis]
MKLYLKVLIGLAVAVVTVFTQNNNCILTGNSLGNLTSIQQQCTEIVIENFTVPANQSLSLRNLRNGTTVSFRGLISFGYAESLGNLIVVSGTNITVIGEPGHLFNCRGERWWDGFADNNGKLKPLFFLAINLRYSSVSGLRIKNTPQRVIAIQSSQQVVFSNITIDNFEGDRNGAHTTIGFDLNESSDITIQGSQIVNQDDCIAINSGTNSYFYDNHCRGGRGISIGPLGNRSSNVVRNVHVRGCTVVNSADGIRIRTFANTTGQVLDITYENIQFQNIFDYGIVVRGDLRGNRPTGNATEGFTIRNFTISNVQGWVRPSAISVFVLLAEGVASNWRWSRVNLTGTRNINSCTGVPPNSGVQC